MSIQQHQVRAAEMLTAAGILPVVTVHTLDQAREIAEAGFIYGLPMVMNYAIMYDYAVDKNSGQYKAPFNHIHSMHNVFSYKDTAIVSPNSDTP
mgnify:CR=1 FL=1